MFSDIDFLSGDIKYIDEYMKEDMLQVVYPNNYILDMGWYDPINKYVIYIVKDSEWSDPEAIYSAETENEIKLLLKEAIRKIEYESNNGGTGDI